MFLFWNRISCSSAWHCQLFIFLVIEPLNWLLKSSIGAKSLFNKILVLVFFSKVTISFWQTWFWAVHLKYTLKTPSVLRSFFLKKCYLSERRKYNSTLKWFWTRGLTEFLIKESSKSIYSAIYQYAFLKERKIGMTRVKQSIEGICNKLVYTNLTKNWILLH